MDTRPVLFAVPPPAPADQPAPEAVAGPASPPSFCWQTIRPRPHVERRRSGLSTTDRVRIAVPDAASGNGLRVALEALDAELRGLPVRDLEVVVTLKSPNRNVVLQAVIETVESWLATEELSATRMQMCGEPHTIVRHRSPVVQRRASSGR